MVALLTNDHNQPVLPPVISLIMQTNGLLPILYGTGTGSKVMSRIAAPMVGGIGKCDYINLVRFTGLL